MKTRIEVVEFLREQLHWEWVCGRPKHGRHHYGAQELRELLDFIYEQEPQTDEEKLVPEHESTKL